MQPLGTLLRNLRMEWGLSLREVTERTESLAKRWGDPRYASSFSHLAKLELGRYDLRVASLISLSYVYSKRPDSLLQACLPPDFERLPMVSSPDETPNLTVLIGDGRLQRKADQELIPNVRSNKVPEDTSLLPCDSAYERNRYRKAIVGLKDRTLYPMIRPGSIILADTYQRAIASPREWTDEFDRPVYLLYTRSGYVCGWCQLSEDGNLLHIVSHVMAKLDVLSLIYGKDVEVVGRVVAVSMSLDPIRAQESVR